jgi:hypothetical protein
MNVNSLNGSFDLATLIQNAKNTKNGSIVVIKGYIAKDGSVCNYYMNFKTSYMSCLKKALESIKNLENINFDSIQFDQAKQEVMESLQKRIENNTNEIVKEDDCFITLCPGVKLHKTLGNVYISGVLIPNQNGDLKDTIQEKTENKKVNSSQKTIIKRWLENQTSLSKWRTFVLNGNFESISLIKE